MSLKVKLVLAFLLLGFVFSAPVGADSPVSDISKKLVCQCGCTMVLSDCSHEVCISRETMTASIEQKIAQGQSEEQIIQSFVAQYGDQVLSAPTKQGFNLIVWVLPFGALLFGGGVVYAALRAWVRQGRAPIDNGAEPAEEGDEEYEQRLEKELDQFTDEGFR